MNEELTGGFLDQKTAEQLARLFNVAFNGALLYGGNHPTTRKGAEPFTSVLVVILGKIGALSIVLDRESLFLEEYCLDKIINCKRMIAQFTKTGIVSVTFERGVQLPDIQTFIKVCGESREVLSVDYIVQAMHDEGCKGIRLNYIRYGKITDDQTVIGKEFEGQAGAKSTYNGESGQISKKTLEDIEEIASLSKLLENPQKTVSALKMGIENPDTTPMVLGALSELRKEMASSSPPSIDIMLNAVYELKVDLSEALEAQKATGRILAMSDPVIAQVDDLTVEVIVKLVKDEYGKGGLSLKRLSQILLRMLPDFNELKRVLPRLKNELIAHGMPLVDYCQLVGYLDTELESEMLSGSLTEAAQGIGVSVKEIVTAIRAQPSEAARLIYLAAEIRQGSKTDDTHLSNLLTDYIEKVTTDLALDRKELAGPQGNQVLRTILLQLEEQLVDKMKKYGVEDKVLHQVKSQLSSRFEGLVGQASDQWLLSVIPEDVTGADEAVSKITSFFGKAFRVDQTRDALVAALQSKGYDQERMDTFFKRLTDQISAGQSIKLPADVLSPNNMRFMLNREIKQQARYSLSLSTIMISIARIRIGDNVRTPQEDELNQLLSQMFRMTKKLIREIDLLGTLGAPYTNIIFLILSMTNATEAVVVVQRFHKAIESRKFSIGNQDVMVQLAISVTSPIKDVTTDWKSYLDLASKNHLRVLDSLAV